jgi:hypothetical protein
MGHAGFNWAWLAVDIDGDGSNAYVSEESASGITNESPVLDTAQRIQNEVGWMCSNTK